MEIASGQFRWRFPGLGFRVLGLRVCLQGGPNNMGWKRQAFAWVLHAFNSFCPRFHDLAQCDRALTGVHKNLFRHIKRFIFGLGFWGILQCDCIGTIRHKGRILLHIQTLILYCL